MIISPRPSFPPASRTEGFGRQFRRQSIVARHSIGQALHRRRAPSSPVEGTLTACVSYNSRLAVVVMPRRSRPVVRVEAEVDDRSALDGSRQVERGLTLVGREPLSSVDITTA